MTKCPSPWACGFFFPEGWAVDEERRARAYVPEDVVHRPKWKIALEEIDRLDRDGKVRFGDVLADVRATARAPSLETVFQSGQLLWTVGIVSNQGLYSTDVRES